MPRNPIDYSKTYVYKIVCKDPTITDVYVGHTTDPTSRKNQHKHRCNNPNDKSYNLLVYQCIRNYGGWDNFEMIIIECISCIDAHDARKNERNWLETLHATLNMSIPTRTYDEYYIQNKDEISETHKQYREQNKDKINEYAKQYTDTHKDKITEYQHQYYEQNKDEVNRKNREKYALKKLQNTNI